MRRYFRDMYRFVVQEAEDQHQTEYGVWDVIDLMQGRVVATFREYDLAWLAVQALNKAEDA